MNDQFTPLPNDPITSILNKRSMATSNPQDPQAEFLDRLAQFQGQYGVSRGQDPALANLSTYEQIRQAAAQGDSKSAALLKKTDMALGDDEMAKADFINTVHDSPDEVDPNNSYQFYNAFAKWSKQSGHNGRATSRMPSTGEIAVQDTANIMAGKPSNFLGLQQDAERHVADVASKLALAGNRSKGGNTPAALQIAAAYKAAIDRGDMQTANAIALSGKLFDKGVLQTQGGEATAMGGYADTLGELSQGKEAGVQRAELEGEPLTAAAVKTAELGTQKVFDAPKAQARIAATLAKSKTVTNKIDQAIGKVNGLSAGYGALWNRWPTSDARDLAADIETIKANLGFDELNEMRQNSPTGGALGQVAVQEIEFLQSVISNLSQSQSPEQLRANLQEVRQAKIDSDRRIQAAYDADYGRFTGEGATTSAPAGNRIRYDAQGNRVQ